MTFVAKHKNAFQKEGDSDELIPRRSEGRLKKLESAIDSRAWAFEEEERSNHLLDLILKTPRKCSGSFIPISSLLNILRACSGEGGHLALAQSYSEFEKGDLRHEGFKNADSKNEELKNTADEAIDKLTLLEEIIEDRDSLQKALECAENEIDELQCICEESEANFKNLTLELENFECEAIREKDEECQCLREECESLQNELENLKSENTTGDDKNFDSLKTELCKLQKQLSCACKEIEKQRCVIENLITERNMLRIKAVQGDDEEMDNLKEKAQEFDRLKYHNCVLEQKLDEFGDIEKQLILANSKLCDMEKIKQERDDFERRYRGVLQLKVECDAIKQQHINTQQIEQQNKELAEKNRQCQECIKEKEKETNRLIMEVKKLTTARDEGQKQIECALSQLCIEMDKKTVELNESSTRLYNLQKAMEASIVRVKCEVKDLKSKLTELEDEVDDLRKKLQQKSKKIETLLSQVEERDKTIEYLSDQLKKKKKNSLRSHQKSNDCYCYMGDQLKDFAKDTIRMEQCASGLTNVTGDKHLVELLEQSKTTVNNLSNELKKKYKC